MFQFARISLLIAITFGLSVQANADSGCRKITRAAVGQCIAGEGKLTKQDLDRIFGFTGKKLLPEEAAVPLAPSETLYQWHDDLFAFTVVFNCQGTMARSYSAYIRPLTACEKIARLLNMGL